VSGNPVRNTIAVLDDDGDRRRVMKSCLDVQFPAYCHVLIDNAPEMLAWLDAHLETAVLISLDHDLGPNRQRGGESWDPGTGRDVADFLASHPPQCPVVIATTNSMARPGMELALQDAGWKTQIVLPTGDLNWVTACWLPTLAGELEQGGERP
jgi:CheY-like chemotaxis protein